MAVTDFSLEPLLNQSTFGSGVDKKISVVPINEVGVGSNRAAVTVNSTRQEITIGTGNRSIHIFNSGSQNIYYGGSTVTSATGIPIFPDATMYFNNVQDTFSIYLVCAAAQTSEARIVEFT